VSELTKYLIATVLLFFWIGGVAILAQLIPLLLKGALPL